MFFLQQISAQFHSLPIFKQEQLYLFNSLIGMEKMKKIDSECELNGSILHEVKILSGNRSDNSVV